MICSLSWRKLKNCRSVEFSLTCHLAPEEDTETRTPFTLAETLSTGMRLTLSSHLDKIPNQSKGSTFYFGSWFQTAAHHEDSQVTGAWGSWPHCHQGQRAMDECTRLTFSFLFHPEPQLLGWCCLYLGFVLPSSVKPFWKHPQKHTQRCFHGDSKSRQDVSRKLSSHQALGRPCFDLVSHSSPEGLQVAGVLLSIQTEEATPRGSWIARSPPWLPWLHPSTLYWHFPTNIYMLFPKDLGLCFSESLWLADLCPGDWTPVCHSLTLHTWCSMTNQFP